MTVALQAAPGATALEFVLRDADGQIVLAAEAPVQPRETISPVFRMEDRRWFLDPGSRVYLSLPPREPESFIVFDSWVKRWTSRF